MRNIERARSHMIILSPPSGKANNTLLSHLNGTIGNAKSTYQYQAASKKLANNATINRPSNNIYYSQTSPSNMGQKKVRLNNQQRQHLIKKKKPFNNYVANSYPSGESSTALSPDQAALSRCNPQTPQKI